MHFDWWHKMPTHSPHTSLRVCVSSTGWALIQPRVQECVLSAGSQSPACVSSAQRQSQGPKNSRSRGTQGQINSEAAYGLLSIPAEILLIILKAKQNMDLSLPATYSHAPRSQQRGSDTPWAAKCPLWKPQRQSVRSLTTALVLQFLFWRDRCQVIQINTWGGGQPFFPLLFIFLGGDHPSAPSC